MQCCVLYPYFLLSTQIHNFSLYVNGIVNNYDHSKRSKEDHLWGDFGVQAGGLDRFLLRVQRVPNCHFQTQGAVQHWQPGILPRVQRQKEVQGWKWREDGNTQVQNQRHSFNPKQPNRKLARRGVPLGQSWRMWVQAWRKADHQLALSLWRCEVRNLGGHTRRFGGIE